MPKKNKIDYGSPSGGHSKTKPGTVPRESKKGWKPSTRNKPCKYYDTVTKTWHQPRKENREQVQNNPS